MSDIKNDGGPAFPVNFMDFQPDTDTGIQVVREQTYGMTLRDWFAGMAMQGMLSEGFVPDQVGDECRIDKWNYANAAYRMADAMIAERNKT